MLVVAVVQIMVVLQVVNLEDQVVVEIQRVPGILQVV
jgi:hypothetical protein